MSDRPESVRQDGLPLAPSLSPTLARLHWPVPSRAIDERTLWLSGIAVGLALIAGFIAQMLTHLIGLLTNLSFYGHFSSEFVSPATNRLGLWVVIVPVLGGVIVGLLARYGSKAIRGHGIPEAMEQVMTNQSRIPIRMIWLKPLSAAISIGTGGPFGAEGPIIATGGALGSALGQLTHTTAAERKTLLAAGAAAGMAATFGSPVSAVLLAIELLLFELNPRSLIPVALASATAAGVRVASVGAAPAFAMPDLHEPGGVALAVYVLLGALVGVVSVGVTKLVYAIEDAFEHLPIHWMWWPALGGVAVGVAGYFEPHSLGVGYDNIERILSGSVAYSVIATLCFFKFVSWAIALGSGTSGGTLAPLFTIGGGVGAGLGVIAAAALPHAGVDLRIAALVGMAAMFAGASRAVLASMVFAFETTRQPSGLLPLLGGCSAAYLCSLMLMRHSIMTEKIARRGVPLPTQYSADVLEQVLVQDVASHSLVSLAAEDSLAKVREWLAASGVTHQGFPVIDRSGGLAGVLTRRDLLRYDADGSLEIAKFVRRRPVVIAEQATLREALDHMLTEHVGRLVVVDEGDSMRPIAMLTRSDILSAHQRRIDEAGLRQKTLSVRASLKRARAIVAGRP